MKSRKKQAEKQSRSIRPLASEELGAIVGGGIRLTARCGFGPCDDDGSGDKSGDKSGEV